MGDGFHCFFCQFSAECEGDSYRESSYTTVAAIRWWLAGGWLQIIIIYLPVDGGLACFASSHVVVVVPSLYSLYCRSGRAQRKCTSALQGINSA